LNDNAEVKRLRKEHEKALIATRQTNSSNKLRSARTLKANWLLSKSSGVTFNPAGGAGYFLAEDLLWLAATRETLDQREWRGHQSLSRKDDLLLVPVNQSGAICEPGTANIS
jgi:hypothetical protein